MNYTRKTNKNKKLVKVGFNGRRTYEYPSKINPINILVVTAGFSLGLIYSHPIYDFHHPSTIVQAQEVSVANLSQEVAGQTLAPESLATESAELSKLTHQEYVESLIREIWGKDAEVGIALAKCESGLRASAANTKSTARGIFQFLAGTWEYERKLMGRSTDLNLRFDAYENVLTGYSHYQRNGLNQPWAESVACVHSKLGK